MTDVANTDELTIESVDADDLVLSTLDNPYNPKHEYVMWQRWDHDKGYNTEEYIARLINMEDDYEADDEFKLNMITSRVIAEILENDEEGIYVLV